MRGFQQDVPFGFVNILSAPSMGGALNIFPAQAVANPKQNPFLTPVRTVSFRPVENFLPIGPLPSAIRRQLLTIPS
jgi:hypothetical protein